MADTSNVDPGVKTDPSVTNESAPETIWYKGQRVIRTILVNLIVIVPTVNGLLLAAPGWFGIDHGVPAPVFVAVNAVAGVGLVVTGILTRIIANPTVNAWLTKLGAGSIPKHAVKG